MTLIILALVFGLSSWLSFRACEPASALYVVDLPNARSLHHQPKPRSGGIGLFVALMLGALAMVADLATAEQIQLLAPMGQALLFVALVSFLDDLYGMPAILRMPLHLLAGGWLVAHGWAPETLQLPYLEWTWSAGTSALFTVLAVGWMINLYNFMDGMDGFSGGMTVIGFFTLSVLGHLGGDPLFSGLAAVVAAAALGFLLFNFPPSSLFMGDTGACVLGFLAASFTLWGAKEQLFPLWSGVMLFLPFVLDSTLTLLGRLSRLEKVWVGQRNHYYHWLLLRVGHTRALLAHCPLMILCAVCALLGREASAFQMAAMTLFLAIVFGSFYAFITRYAQRHPILEEMDHSRKTPDRAQPALPQTAQ